MIRAVLPGEVGEVHQLDPFRRIGPTVVVPTPAWFGELSSDSARSRYPGAVLVDQRRGSAWCLVQRALNPPGLRSGPPRTEPGGKKHVPSCPKRASSSRAADRGRRRRSTSPVESGRRWWPTGGDRRRRRRSPPGSPARGNPARSGSSTAGDRCSGCSAATPPDRHALIRRIPSGSDRAEPPRN